MYQLSNTVSRKFTAVVDLNEWEIDTPDGWVDMSCVMQTVSYDMWHIECSDGLWVDCADDHILIMQDGSERFAKDVREGEHIKSINGKSCVTLCEFTGKSEQMYDVQVESESHHYFSNGLVSHNTTTVGAYLLWEAIFTKNLRIAVLANKGDTAREILSRMKSMFEDLPWFLKPGVVEWNKGSIEFSNGTKIVSAATSNSSIRGQSMNIIYLDELAFIQNDTEFFASTYPVISAGETTKVIITSTPNGMNLFYKLWSESKSGKNSFVNLEFLWHHHPQRGEAWKLETLRNISQKQFDQEFNCVVGETLVTVRDTDTGEVRNISIEELYHLVLKDATYEILTENGFKPFSGVRRSKASSLCRVLFDNGVVIKSTLDHRFKLESGEFAFAKSLKPGSRVSPRGAVVSIKLIDSVSEFVYDLVDVQGGHHYLTNSVTSHNCVFMGSSDTLISGHKLQQLTFVDPIEFTEDLMIYEKPLEGHTYAITVDVGEGIGKDFSIISVFDITSSPYKHIAVFRNNVMPPLMLSTPVYNLAKQYNDAYVIVESNSVGKITADALYYDFEYENMLTGSVKDSENVVGSSHIGVRTTRKTKAIGCSSMKTMIESDTLMLYDFNTVSELTSFIKKGNSFEAESNKTDDIVMTLVIFSWFAAQPYFEDVTNVNMRDTIKANFARLEDQNHTVFGFYDDGTASRSDGIDGLFQ